MKPLNDRFPYYWICDACATERGGKWPNGHVATVIMKTCEYCNGKNHLLCQPIAPWVDYNWVDLKTDHLRD